MAWIILRCNFGQRPVRPADFRLVLNVTKCPRVLDKLSGHWYLYVSFISTEQTWSLNRDRELKTEKSGQVIEFLPSVPLSDEPSICLRENSYLAKTLGFIKRRSWKILSVLSQVLKPPKRNCEQNDVEFQELCQSYH